MSVSAKDYDNKVENSWCPGCGNFAILNSLKKALAELDLAPHQVVVFSGIGQAAKMPHFMHVNMFNGLHGRAIPAATAARMLVDDLKIIVSTGDGDGYGEGGNHLLHAIRRNIDLTVIAHDNKYYGLTKGQASPTTPLDTHTVIDVSGVKANPLNPLALAISQSCSFVAQSSSAFMDHLTATLKQAIEHRGLSLVNVLQPCVSWDKVHTAKYYREHCYELAEDYDPRDQLKALELVLKIEERLPIGIIFQNDRPAYEEVKSGGKYPAIRNKTFDPGIAERIYNKLR